jgi:hypothetical protein
MIPGFYAIFQVCGLFRLTPESRRMDGIKTIRKNNFTKKCNPAYYLRSIWVKVLSNPKESGA